MKRAFFVAVMTVAVLLITPKTYSQTTSLRLRFHVPFSFSVNNQTFTPGDYEVTRQSLLLLRVTNLKSKEGAFEPVYPAQSRKEGNGQVRLVFHRYGSQYFLAAVSNRSWEYTYDFQTSTEEKQLAQSNRREPLMTVSVDPEGTVLATAGQD